MKERLDVLLVGRGLAQSREKAKAIILENRHILDGCAQLLLEKEKISREEFERLSLIESRFFTGHLLVFTANSMQVLAGRRKCKQQ